MKFQQSELQENMPEKAFKKNKLWFYLLIFVLMAGIVSTTIYYFEYYERGERATVDLIEKAIDSEVADNAFINIYMNEGNISQATWIDENYVWIAGNGLARYDKKTGEKKYFTEANGLLGNSLTDIVEYGDKLWVTSQRAGMNILNTEDYSWRYFTSRNGLVNTSNLKMELDGDYLWLATFDGIGRFDFNTDTWTNWTAGEGVVFSSVSNLLVDDKYVWFYVSPNARTIGGIVRVDKNTLEWTDMHKYENSPNRQLFLGAIKIFENRFYAIDKEQVRVFNEDLLTWEIVDLNSLPDFMFDYQSVSHDNKQWYFNESTDLETYNLDTKEIEVIDTEMLRDHCSTKSPNFTYDFKDGLSFYQNELWFGCAYGLVKYDIDNKNWEYKPTAIDYPAKIDNVFAEKEGKLLVDTDLGLGFIDPENKNWVLIKELKNSGGMFMGVSWQGNDLFIKELKQIPGPGYASNDPIFWHYDVQEKLLTALEVPESYDLKDTLLWGSLMSNKGRNLFISNKNGIFEYNTSENKITFYETENSGGLDYAVNDSSMYKDKLWYISNDPYSDNSGLNYFDINTKKFKFIGLPEGKKTYGLTYKNMSFTGDKIWIKLQGDFYSYDLRTDLWEKVVGLKNMDRQEMPYMDVNDEYIVVSRKGYVDLEESIRGDVSFITTAHTYLYFRNVIDIYDIKNETWTTYTSEDGILGGEVGDIFIDNNKVWVLQPLGLYTMHLP